MHHQTLSTPLYRIRLATPTDIDAVMQLVAAAKETMQRSGNPHQWTDGYPQREIIEQDIRSQTCYLLEQEGVAQGSFVLKPGPDPTYAQIFGGEWQEPQRPYHVIHRVTSLPTAHGILAAILHYSTQTTPNLRIDTHEENTIMRHLLVKYGFSYQGKIFTDNGGERMAYQRIISTGNV